MRIVRDRKEHDGFFWVEQLLVNGRPVQETAQDLDILSGISGAWEVRFEVLSPLFIGSGEVDVADEPGVPTMHFRFARRGECVIVPGSSLKGVIRSLVEVLSPSCLGGEDHARCPACLLFGTLGRRGRVTFEDGAVENAELSVMQIAQRTQARRIGPNNERGFRKLYSRDQGTAQATWSDDTERLETVLPGSRFRSRVSFHTLAEWQVGLLLLALGLAPGYGFHLKCGGGKNRGFGLLRSSWGEGVWAESQPWFWGRRQAVTEAQLQTWVDAYRCQAETWGIWSELPPLLACLQEEYRHEP
jgi:CRISPR/Cas system CSM-associated protein Csm3 (group 7 of RAMP superfamily)